jgi:hypothetical protein
VTGPSHPRTFVRRPAGHAAKIRPPAPPTPSVEPPPPVEAGSPGSEEATVPGGADAPSTAARPSPGPRPAPAPEDEARADPARAAEPVADTAPVDPAPVDPAPAPTAEVAPPVAPAPVAPAPVAPPSAAPVAVAAPATRTARSRPRIPFWLVKPLLGLVLAVLALLVMVRLVTADDGPAAPTVTPSAVATTVAAPGPAGAQAGTITVGGVFLLPLSTSTDSTGSLAARTGQVVQAQGVQVLSTPSADGAWVGTSAENRVYVQLVGSSSGAVTPSTGQRLSFTGTLVPNGGGLAVGDGADLLARQTQHVEVFAGALSVA